MARLEGLEGRLGGGENEKNEDGRQAEKSAAPAQRHLGPLLQREGAGSVGLEAGRDGPMQNLA